MKKGMVLNMDGDWLCVINVGTYNTHCIMEDGSSCHYLNEVLEKIPVQGWITTGEGVSERLRGFVKRYKESGFDRHMAGKQEVVIAVEREWLVARIRRKTTGMTKLSDIASVQYFQKADKTCFKSSSGEPLLFVDGDVVKAYHKIVMGG